MFSYILQRLLMTLLLLLSVATISFFLIDLIPGSPAEVMLQEGATPENVAALEEEMGLNDPFWERFGRWLGRSIRGDFGTSINSGRPVTTILIERLPITLSIVFVAIALGTILGLFGGTLAGLRPGSWVDRGVTIVTSLFVALPGFWLALLLLAFIVIENEWFGFANPFKGVFPAVGYTPFRESPIGWLRSIVLPSVALSIPTGALVARQMRSSMSNVLQSKYVQAARARGVPRRQIVSQHALRNALIPVVTVIGFRIAVALGQSFVIDRIFALNGIGDFLVTSVLQQDIPAIQGGLILTALIVAFTNLFVDLSYAWLNPKVRLT